jgi:hypothetical protein
LAEMEPLTLAPRPSNQVFISSRLMLRVPVMTTVFPA